MSFDTSESITFDDYEMQFDAGYPPVLHITNTTNQHTMHMTVEEAIGMLKLMYSHRSELSTLRIGEQ